MLALYSVAELLRETGNTFGTLNAKRGLFCSLFFVCTGIIDPAENCTGSRLLVFACWEVCVAVQVWSLENLSFLTVTRSMVKSSDVQGRTLGFVLGSPGY